MSKITRKLALPPEFRYQRLDPLAIAAGRQPAGQVPLR